MTAKWKSQVDFYLAQKSEAPATKREQDIFGDQSSYVAATSIWTRRNAVLS